MLEGLKKGLRNIFRKKLRSILTIAGISIGVLSVVIISTIGEVGKGMINSELDSLGISGIAISANSKATDVRMYTTELKEILSYESVDTAMPLIVQYTSANILQQSNACIAWGVDTTAPEMVTMNIKYGRLINKNDLALGSKVCVVDEKFALDTYKRKNIVGKTISVSMDGEYVDFKVIGIVESGGNILQGLMGNYIPTFVYVPYTTLESLVNKDNFDQIIVKLKDGVDAEAVTNTIVNRLEEKNGMEDSISVENLVQQKEKLNNILNIITSVLGIIAAISLVVAGLSIMTVMLVSVNERTREIGIKKSIGAKRIKIMLEFMLESFLISMIGSLIGIAAGIVLSFAGCQIMGISFQLNISMTAFCLIFAIIVGIVFGVYPAIKASNMNPVDALRYE